VEPVICCCSGSGSDFGKVLVPVPDQTILSTVLQQFNNKKFWTKSCLSISEAALLPRKSVCQFDFFDFFILFWMDSDPNAEPDLEL
jgi:hypothetical protein